MSLRSYLLLIHTHRSPLICRPEDTPSAILTAEEVSNLASQLSPGIVSLEVRVESELAPSPTLEMINEEGEITTAVIDGVRVRRVGVFVKVSLFQISWRCKT